jgi:hypothetical protein
MHPVYAADSVNIGDPGVFQPAAHFSTIGSIVNVAVPNIFMISGLILLVLLIFGGFQYIVAAGSGDAKAMEKGAKALTSAVLGLILVVGSFWIVQIVETVTGLTLLPK